MYSLAQSRKASKSHIRRVNACKKIMRLMVGALNGRGPRFIEPAEPAIATPLMGTTQLNFVLI